MPLLQRVQRLFRADLHALLDHWEDPVLLLRQSIREMGDSIEAEQLELHALHKKQHALEREHADRERALAQLELRLDTAFRLENDEHARALVREKIQLGAGAASHDAHKQRIDDDCRLCRARIEQHKHQLHLIQDRARMLEDQVTTPPAEAAAQNLSVTEAELELAFLAEREKRQSS